MRLFLMFDAWLVCMHKRVNKRKFALSVSINNFIFRGIKMNVSIPSNITTVTLTATADALLNGGLVWASSDESKCTVAANGDTLSAIVTRVAPGSVTVTAHDAADNLTGTIELDFVAAPTEITINATF